MVPASFDGGQEHVFEAGRNSAQKQYTSIPNVMMPAESESLDHNITAAVECNKLLTITRPVELIKRSTASASLTIAM